MAPEPSSAAELELGHVLFMDIVGYSKLLVDEQSNVARQLNQVVKDTEQVRSAEAKGKLIRLPTGDGMALVFFTSPEAPMQCALAISRALKQHPAIKLRMGLHSGPVNPVSDVNERDNVAGIGINIAQRVMNCGDAGHILLSKRVADDLSQYTRWRGHVHDLGQIEVKHGVKVEVASFYNEEVGNAELPEKFKQAAKASRLAVRRRRKKMLIGGAALIAIGAGIGLRAFRHQSWRAFPVSDKSIAVLPFANLSDEKENAYFADGVQDEILTDLAKIADLKVISRTSVMPYKAGTARNLREIAQQLGVAHILEGSVQRAAGKVRVNAQLIDARTDKHLWAQTYDRALADVFTIETEVAQAIANELQAKLSPVEKESIEERPTKDVPAYDFYVRATPLIESIAYSSTQEKDLFTAVDLLKQAVARDPSFILAYCRLAAAHDQIYFQEIDRTPTRLAMAKSAIDSAFQLKPDCGEAHFALAMHLYYGYFDFDHARAELALAQKALPNNAEVFALSGVIDRRQSRWSEAVRNLERASELDPRNPFRLIMLATTSWLMHDYEQVHDALTRLLTLDPKNVVARTWRAGIAMDRNADTRPFREEIEKILAEDPAQGQSDHIKRPRFFLALLERDFAGADRAVAALPERNPMGDDSEFNRDFWVGLVARLKGDSAAAQAALTRARADREKQVQIQPENGPFLSGLGLIDAGLGRKEDALQEGQRAIELTPLEKNSLHGSLVRTDFARICAWTGERDLALKQLEELTRIPGGPTYGDLRLSPDWDSLRNDPRFEKVVALLAPKETK